MEVAKNSILEEGMYANLQGKCLYHYIVLLNVLYSLSDLAIYVP